MPSDQPESARRKVMRVVVIDDQSFMRLALRKILEVDGDIEVVGEARTGVEGIGLAHELKPDAITMDVEMPEMDGLEACARILREVVPRPIIIMVSAHTQHGAKTAIRALALGASDFVSKASLRAATDLAHIDTELRAKLRAWCQKRFERTDALPPVSSEHLPRPVSADLIVVAVSTGGPYTLTKLLKVLGPIEIPMVIGLHIPEFFTASVAEMLSGDTGCRVVEGTHGQMLQPGVVTLIPGGRDGVIGRRRGGGYELRFIESTSSVHPSGNALLESAAIYATSPVGVVLTGMGDDAARGAAALQRRGAAVYVQDPDTCIVDGMPRAAIAAAPDALVVSIEELARQLAHASRRPNPGKMSGEKPEPLVDR